MCTRGIKAGDRVTWLEGTGHRICRGTVINEEKYQNGTNPYGAFNIRVDDQYLSIACHTAREMHLGWVVRSVTFNDLDLVRISE